MSEILDPPASAAATLVLMRPGTAGGPPELLVIERAGVLVFAGGATVFPGGRVDPGDHDVAADPALASGCDDPDDAAARVAAIRETIEETGIAAGFPPTDAARAAIRAGLGRGEPFAALLRAGGFRLDLAALVPFARWLPRFETVKRRFDTRFYAAVAPAAAEPVADGGESVHAAWASAAAVIADADAGRRHIIFPTRRNLERLAGYGSFAALRAAVAGTAIATISPWIEEREGVRWLCIPEDRGYPVTAERLDLAKRG